jgi:spectinomycin phosphotransferase
MLEKPDVPDERLIACLRDDYGVRVTEIAFLPLGYDVNTAVYRVADGATPYFLKLRSGDFDEATIAIPRFLYDCGISAVIPPIPTGDKRLWTRMDAYAVVLSPFIIGRNGWDQPLSDRQWVDFGSALRGLHTANMLPSLTQGVPHETFSPHWRDMVREFQARAADTAFIDPVAARTAAFLRDTRDRITDLVGRAKRLGDALRAQPLPNVLCHADIHAGNVLLAANGALFIVDWDTLLFAPKERDLMFIGGGIGAVWQSPREEALFYQGYGPTAIDPMAIAYYRYERIVEDIAAFCEQLLLTDDGGADREQSLRYLMSSFLPGAEMDIAYQSDTLPHHTEISLPQRHRDTETRRKN